MKRNIIVILIFVLCFGLSVLYRGDIKDVQAQGNNYDQKITVLSPAGQPPLIRLKPLAPRLDNLENKTVYLVNDGYLGTDILLGEMETWFKDNMPEVTTVYRRKGGGGFTAEDPELWAELEDKADAVIMGMGH